DRTHDAREADQLLAVVQRDPLLAADEQIAVRQALGDRDRDAAVEPIALARVGLTAERALRRDLVVQDRRAVARDRPAAEDREAGIDLGRLRAARARFLRRVRALDESHGQDVADIVRAQIHEEVQSAAAVDRAGGRGGPPRGRARRPRAGGRGGPVRRRGAAREHGDGGGDQDAVHEEPPGTHQRLFVTCSSIRSLVEIARDAISYARCVSIMLTSSSTTFTFEVSSAPCTSRPRPFSPGVPGCGGPLATVSTYRFSPRGWRPAGFTKSKIGR